MTDTEKAMYGPTNPREAPDGIQRYASVIGLKPEKEQVYRELHANAWPGVIARLKQSNIHNYSIYIAEIEQTRYLFSYFEYSGDDLEKDSQAMAEDAETQRWWKETDPCQFILNDVADNERWKPVEQVFWMA